MGDQNNGEPHFLSIVAHELATPITLVKGLADTLSRHRRDLTEAQIDEFLDDIHLQAERLHSLVTALVDDASLGNGRFEVAVQEVDLAQVTKRALDNAPPPGDKTVEVTVPVGLLVIADPRRLDQVLVNLLHNAYRHGGPEVRLDARRMAGGVLVTVSDNGVGVPHQFVPHLFERFSRGPNATGTPGTGLGLALTRELVEAFGGRIWYEAHIPTGASFNFTLAGGGQGSDLAADPDQRLMGSARRMLGRSDLT